MKINKKTTKKIKEKREIEIGEKGDFILIRAAGRDVYTFGKLEGVVKHPDNHGNVVFSIKFDGESYLFRSQNVFGKEFAFFDARKNKSYYRDSHLFDTESVEEVVSGIDNIITYLENHPQEDKRKYADLIKRIRDS